MSELQGLITASIAEKSLAPSYPCTTYETWQINIPEHNSNNSTELPIPETYILDTDCIIRCAFAVMDHTRRLGPAIIIEQIKSH